MAFRTKIEVKLQNKGHMLKRGTFGFWWFYRFKETQTFLMQDFNIPAETSARSMNEAPRLVAIRR